MASARCARALLLLLVLEPEPASALRYLNGADAWFHTDWRYYAAPGQTPAAMPPDVEKVEEEQQAAEAAAPEKDAEEEQAAPAYVTEQVEEQASQQAPSDLVSGQAEVAPKHVTEEGEKAAEAAPLERPAETNGRKAATRANFSAAEVREQRKWAAAHRAEQAAAKTGELNAAQERTMQRDVRQAKWEALEKRREAERLADLVAWKLAAAKRASSARSLAELHKERARLQCQVAEASARAREERESMEAEPHKGGVRVNVIDAWKHGVQLTLKEGARAHVLMSAAASRMGLMDQKRKLHFFHKGVELKAHDLIEKYNIEDLDTVDVRAGP